MRIFDDPIETNRDKALSIERFYAEFNDILESIVEDEKTPAAKSKAEECVSLCRTAVAAFAHEGRFQGVRQIIVHFNKLSGIIIEAGHFTTSHEFNILEYSTDSDDAAKCTQEKLRLSKNFLPKLYSTVQPAEPEPQKYHRAALFQGLDEVAKFYRSRYGRWSEKNSNRKASDG